MFGNQQFLARSWNVAIKSNSEIMFPLTLKHEENRVGPKLMLLLKSSIL